MASAPLQRFAAPRPEILHLDRGTEPTRRSSPPRIAGFRDRVSEVVPRRGDDLSRHSIVAVRGRSADRNVSLVAEIRTAHLELRIVPEIAYRGIVQCVGRDLDRVRRITSARSDVTYACTHAEARERSAGHGVLPGEREETVRRKRRSFAEARRICGARDFLVEMRIRRVEVERGDEVAHCLDLVAARTNLALLHREELMIRIWDPDVRLRDLKDIRSEEAV